MPVAAQPAALPVCGTWRIVPVPGLPARSTLNAVAATATDAAWAVGYANSNDDGRGNWTLADPLILHWNGARWQAVSVPSPGQERTVLRAVAARTRSDVWVVGDYQPVGGVQQSLVLHWDGWRWARVASPTIDEQHTNLNAVIALSANDAWAVGSAGADFTYSTAGSDPSRALILHWNGHDWSEVPAPNPGSIANQLQTLTAAGRNDIWAFGLALSRPTGVPPTVSFPAFNDEATLALHWDGTRWLAQPAPHTGNFIQALSLAPNNLWTISTSFQEGGPTIYSGHWNGQAWSEPTIAPLPPIEGARPEPELHGVTARGLTDIWAAGSYAYANRKPGTSTWERKTLITHWDGTRWATIPSPNVPGVQNSLSGIAAVPGGSLWAVGGTRPEQSAVGNALILRYTPAVCRR